MTRKTHESCNNSSKMEYFLRNKNVIGKLGGFSIHLYKINFILITYLELFRVKIFSAFLLMHTVYG